MQWTLRKPVASAYLENQRMTNRMTAQGYTAWDNVFAGNRYNLRLWLGGFKRKLRDGLDAQIRAIMTSEGLSAASGIIGLAIIFVAMVYRGGPQHRRHGSADRARGHAAAPDRDDQGHAHARLRLERLLASWARLGGVADNMHPGGRAGLRRAHEVRLAGAARRRARPVSVTSLDEAMALILSQPTGRINVRGANGVGQVDAAGQPQGRDQEPRLLLADDGPAGVQVRRRRRPEGSRSEIDRTLRSRRAADAERQEGRLLVRRAPAQVAAGDLTPYRRVGLSARRMGRQSRHQQPRAGRRAGRQARPARPRHRNFAPRPRLKRRHCSVAGRGAADGLAPDL